MKKAASPKEENVLISFTGFQDPYTLGLVGDEEQPGPILSLLAVRSFDGIILISTPRTEENTSKTHQAIRSLYPKVTLNVLDLHLEDPTDYSEIMSGLRKYLLKMIKKIANARLYISVSSGTPQMHACWLLLAACGDIPAKLLSIRPPRFVTKERPLINEVDLSSKDFPAVQAKICEIEEPYIPTTDEKSVVSKLGIVGDHINIKRALEIGAALAPSMAPILLLGETGTGKELFARFIHLMSGRPPECFVPINCAAIPPDLMESVIFGHKKGAFTGAISDQIGKFDKADGGTLFLDELGELSPAMQAKLLRVIEDGIVEPLGAQKPHSVDVRIVAATNKDLRKAIKKGQFREDLYYRLNVGEIRLPALRERKSDIPRLALRILDRINASLKNPKRLTSAALSRLENYSWPGNVRDLENVIERSARLTPKEVLDADDLMISDPITYADPLAALPEPGEGFSLEEFMGSVRKQLILRAVEMAGGNKSEAARLLGMTPQAVHKFFRKNGGNLNQG